MKKIILTVFIVSIALIALAESVQVGDLSYILNDSNKTAEVTHSFADNVNYAGKTSIIVPDIINYNGNVYKVIGIGESAFSDCSNIKSVSLPKSLTSIGAWAFNGCSSIESISIPNSVTNIGTCAFQLCSSLVSIIIPNSVTEIGSNVFNHCSSLESIIIGDNVTEIGMGFLSFCTSLKVVSIGNKVTSLGMYAFRECSSLSSIALPRNIKTIKASCFFDCSSLTSIIIGDSIQNIEAGVFRNCTSLDTIYCYSKIPPTVHKYTFEDNGSNSTRYEANLYVLCESLADYQAHEIWGMFKNIQCNSSENTSVYSVTSIGKTTNKLLRNGQLIIIRDGKEYNVLGTKM